MKLNFVKILSLLAVMLVLFDACKKETIEPVSVASNSGYDIILNWYINDSETKEEFETGLKWCFSFLGARLEKGSWERSIEWTDGEQLVLHFDEMGFDENAQVQLKKLISLYRSSDEFRTNGGVDAGRFVVSIFNNPNHYYKIVNMPETIDGFRSLYNFNIKKTAIIESAVAFGERVINTPKSRNNIGELAYVAEELSGSVLTQSHQTKEFEVMDVMDNGQLRFGIYTTSGQLINGADKVLSTGGKPAKCLWCHEVNVQKGFAAQTAVANYYSPFQFDSLVEKDVEVLKNYRNNLNTEVHFNDLTEHTELEKLYIRFMEPSAKRLAMEWGISVSDVQEKLITLTTHKHDEFPEMGDLYFRQEVEPYSPFKVLSGIKNARETEQNEPDYLL